LISNHLDFRVLKPVQALVAGVFFRRKRLAVALPRQEGKTELGVRFGHDLLRRPFSKSSLFVAKDRKSAKKATYEKFQRLYDKKHFEVNTEHVYLKECPTSILYTDSADKDPDRMRGGTYGYIHGSEVAFWKMEKGVTVIDIVDKVFQPTLRKRGGYAFMESTMNGKNGWFEFWNRAEEFGFHTLRMGLSDLVYLGLVKKEEYDEIKKTTQPDVFRQEYECEWISFQGKTYPEFRQEWHVDPDMQGPLDYMTVVSAIDWGYHPSATCILFAYVKDGVVNIFDEHYKKEELIDQTAKAIEWKNQFWRVGRYAAVADHEPRNIAELNRRGIACGNADKANTLGARIHVKEMFFKHRIKIHPRCEYLIRDLEAAVWDDKKEGEIDYGQCTWGHFDAESALRYLIRELSEMETPTPEENPHWGVDSISAQEWLMRQNLKDLENAFSR
jgi:hypothetical protein